MFCGSSSRCCGFVCSMWLWYFLLILTFSYCVHFSRILKHTRLVITYILKVSNRKRKKKPKPNASCSLTWPRGYETTKLFHDKFYTEHGIKKTKCWEIYTFLAVGILTFISMINFILSWFEHEIYNLEARSRYISTIFVSYWLRWAKYSRDWGNSCLVEIWHNSGTLETIRATKTNVPCV